MANYEGYFKSSCIEVKNPDEFEAKLKQLGFSEESEGGFECAWYQRDRDNDFQLYGYCSIPNMTFEDCLDGQDEHFGENSKNSPCPNTECPYNHVGTCKGEDEGVEFDLANEIQPHLKPGTIVRITEVGYEKLCYLIAYCVEITPEGITSTDIGVDGDIMAPKRKEKKQ